jgi:ferritin
MTLNKTIQDALNEHMNQEFYASYLYLSMSAYCEEINLPGFAHWMRVQSQEEYSHAMKMFDFIVKQKAPSHRPAHYRVPLAPRCDATDPGT